MRLCRRFSETSKKFFRSFLIKKASVVENQADGEVPSVQISPTERENRKNERNSKCEHFENRRHGAKMSKTNGIPNVKIEKIADRALKSQKRTEASRYNGSLPNQCPRLIAISSNEARPRAIFYSSGMSSRAFLLRSFHAFT